MCRAAKASRRKQVPSPLSHSAAAGRPRRRGRRTCHEEAALSGARPRRSCVSRLDWRREGAACRAVRRRCPRGAMAPLGGEAAFSAEERSRRQRAASRIGAAARRFVAKRRFARLRGVRAREREISRRRVSRFLPSLRPPCGRRRPTPRQGPQAHERCEDPPAGRAVARARAPRWPPQRRLPALPGSSTRRRTTRLTPLFPPASPSRRASIVLSLPCDAFVSMRRWCCGCSGGGGSGARARRSGAAVAVARGRARAAARVRSWR